MQGLSRRARIAAGLTALVTFAFAITTLVTLQRLQGMPLTVTTVDMDLRSEKALTVRSPSSRIETLCMHLGRRTWGAGYQWLWQRTLGCRARRHPPRFS